MKIVVTCGPSIEPIDQMRVLTNRSTGELGTILADELASAGHEVVCFRGTFSSHSVHPTKAALIHFSSNDDLLGKLSQEADKARYQAVFHTAALCDFRVRTVKDARGRPLEPLEKYPSRSGSLQLELEPAAKVLPHLARLFPEARVVGWKFELVGNRADAIDQAVAQITEVGSAGCVVNGAAYGSGFGFCNRSGLVEHVASKTELARFLARWLNQTR